MAGTVESTTDTSTDTSTDSARCPCGTGDAYGACCARFHRGAAAAPTAEALMRSRYTAFARRDTAYLARTWHPSTRPAADELHLDDDQRWLRLDVLETTGGGPFDDEGTVTFAARWRSGPDRGVLRERSRFVREALQAGAAGTGTSRTRPWLYVDGEIA